MLRDVDSFHSIGNYYAYITHLDSKPRSMKEKSGLAAYGEPMHVDILKRFITCDDGTTVNKTSILLGSCEGY
jgi:hypothetical protein